MLPELWTAFLSQNTQYRMFDVHSKNKQLLALFMKTGLNNVLLPTLFTIANDIAVWHRYT